MNIHSGNVHFIEVALKAFARQKKLINQRVAELEAGLSEYRNAEAALAARKRRRKKVRAQNRARTGSTQRKRLAGMRRAASA